ncbi:MAG: hypothetical protein K2N10_06175 [Muribaculaceae bacterium]|nr:hypothetical protein [Muribaculaceae bacterium]
MTKNIIRITLGALCLVSLSLNSCFSSKSLTKPINVPLTISNTRPNEVFTDLDKPIRLSVRSEVQEDEMVDISGLSAPIRKFFPKMEFNPSVQVFATDATTSYLHDMNFKLNLDADYCLNVIVRELKLTYESESKLRYSIRLSCKLTDASGQTIAQLGNATGIVDNYTTSRQINNPFGEAYIEALNSLNWNRVADYLRIAKTPKQEKNAQVTGAGDTAREHSVIRWYILSSPQGADVSWRVISSTPDVANTNSNFVGTTPYESTESFDIKGLTYNNSGNVQIEVSCEKPGYLTQRKRFNLRQAIDQKEISAKFNLIKDE